MQKRFLSLALASLSLAALGTSAQATSCQEASSLLVFPLFDNGRDAITLLTVTNTNGDLTPVGNLFAGTVDVEFIYINSVTCQEFNRTRRLTPKDTITVATFIDNPNQVRGYAYAFAKNPTTGQAIKFDYLIGTSLIVTGEGTTVSELSPFAYKGAEGLAAGAPTNVDGDSIRDLNGNEYEPSADRIYIPRFLGQNFDGNGTGRRSLLGFTGGSELVLINLTGGSEFTAILDFLIYNDNEEVFSAQYSFRCWARVPLTTISGAFLNSFLLSTNHNPNEIQGGNGEIPEAGWYEINGQVATSTATSISDPAFLAVQIEQIGIGVAALPFMTGTQTNGDLLPHGVFGDMN